MTSSFQFLHAADIHLDSPLRGLAGQEGNTADRVRTATREALDQLVGLAIRERVDFVVLAGDLYDGDWRDYRTGLFFVGQMGRLRQAGIPVYLLHGNHDAESQITRRLELPDNLHVFGSRAPETFRRADLQAVLHGQSFGHRDETGNLARGYPPPVPGAFNLGVLHTGLGGLGGHANYAPCSLDDLVQKGYDYWALGHVHQQTVLHERPHVVFPGNLQGRHVRESGAKGAYRVSVEGGEVTGLEFLPCDVVRWAVLDVRLDGADSMGDVSHRMRGALEAAVAEAAGGPMLAVRLVLTGRTGMHAQLVAEEDAVLAEARAGALGFGEERAWVEKVVMSTEPPVDPQARLRREDAVGELQRMLQDAGTDENLRAQLAGDIGELVRRLPHDARAGTEDPVLAAAMEGEYAALVDRVLPYLSARLTAGDD